MAPNPQAIAAAKQAGYSDQEIQSYLQNQQSQPQGITGITQQASGLIRSLGLGAIPTIAASIYEGGRAISSAMGNKDAYFNAKTGETVQNPFATEADLNKFSNPASATGEALKNTAGLASWAIPETNVFKTAEGANALTKILAVAGNKSLQGAVQGGLGAVSQGQDPTTGAVTGAVVNPAMAGLGNLAVEQLPKYIGFRNFGRFNFGNAGKTFPEIVNAENAAGDQTLLEARNNLLSKIKPFDTPAPTLNPPTGGVPNLPDMSPVTTPNTTNGTGFHLKGDLRYGQGNVALKDVSVPTPQVPATGSYLPDTTVPANLPNPQVLSPDRQKLLDSIDSLANSRQWKGTNGVSDLVKHSASSLASPEGAAPDIKSIIENSSDPFDAYSQIKNYADSLGAYNDKKTGKLTDFLKSAAHTIRESVISSTDNPAATRDAMDNYAAQTSMLSGVQNKAGSYATKMGGFGEGGLALAASLSPAHGLTVPLLLDSILSNPATGPAIGRGLVNTGNKVQQSGLNNLLTRLGISGVQNIMNSSQTGQ